MSAHGDDSFARARTGDPATGGTGEGPAGGAWTVDFWLDPVCPLTLLTARWAASIAPVVPFDLRWRVMSLSVLNEHRDDDPEHDPHGYLWIPARIAAAVQTGHGHAALGAFHTALWTDPDGSERRRVGDPAEALRRVGLPEDLAEAGHGTVHDADLRASHHEGVDRIDAEIGTPVLSVTAPDGGRRTFFGPVLRAVPSPEEAVRLWDGLLLMTGVPAFREVKR